MSDCLGAQLPEFWYRDGKMLRSEVEHHGSMRAATRAHPPLHVATLSHWWGVLELGPVPTPRGAARTERINVGALSEHHDWLLDSLKVLGDDASIEEIADHADVSPRRVREAADFLGVAGFRIEAGDDRVSIDRLPRPSGDRHELLFSGDTHRFGVVSDVHLNSKHCRLEELHIAYDRFVAEGIDTVYNPGDIVAGRGIFRGQDHEIINHTYETQVDYAVENYPRRDGITTKIISGNHDAEGDFGRAGADACRGVANKRDDIEWCGMYAADFVLPNGAVMTMRHPMGGSSYAKSYKPQKFAESFEGGTKPNVVLFGHWHNMLYTFERNIHMLNCGTFEGYGGTLGLRVPLGAPAVGYFIVDMTIAEDASVVRFRPEFLPFFAGRH